MTLHDTLIEEHAWDGKCNARGLSIIKHYEGWSAEPYICPAGYWTIGYGSIWRLDGKRVAGDCDPISQDEGEFLLRREVGHVEQAIRALVRVPLNENQFSALCSWTYNLGSGRLKSSSLRMHLNRGQYDKAAAEFPKWTLAGGKRLQGLVRRRAAEKALFIS